MTRWTPAFSLADLPVGGSQLFKRERLAIAVFRLGHDELYAIDNRCPHEGYPLTQGTVRGCTLTCCYHNFKFDLRSGACLMGDERVGTWPVRVEHGVVELDLTPPDRSTQLPARWESLRAGLLDERTGQVARDVVRLLDLGATPAQIAAFGAAVDGSHAKWGSSHGLPVLRDSLRWVADYPGLQAAHPLTQALAQVARSCARRPAHVLPAAIDPGPRSSFAERLAERVETEDMAGSLGLLRGALAAGWRAEPLRPAFLRLVSDHFLDFGHGLIFVVRGFELLELADWHGAEAILGGLLRGIVNGTREDSLPAWGAWHGRMVEVASELEGWAAQGGPVDVQALATAIVDGGASQAFAAVQEALASGASPLGVSHALCLAAAWRMLRFRIAIDADPAVQDTWLSVSHNLTFCSAVRQVMAAAPGGGELRLLFQAVHFVAGNRKLDGEGVLPEAPAGTVNDVIDDILAHRPDRAASRVAAVDLDELEGRLKGLAMADPVVRPIYTSHVMKIIVVGALDSRALGRAEPMQAAVRLLASPHAERRVARLVGEAISLVEHGRVPKRLGY